MLENKENLKSEAREEIEEGLVRHFLYAIVLIRLQNSERLSGYDFLGYINCKFGLLLSPGSIYALLYAMEREGLIQGSSTRGKRTYELTDRGNEKAKVFVASKEQIQSCIQTIIDRAQFQ